MRVRVKSYEIVVIVFEMERRFSPPSLGSDNPMDRRHFAQAHALLTTLVFAGFIREGNRACLNVF
jgi:hypothetical protein